MAEQELYLERLRWPEVEAALRAGRTTAIVPCGAVEQHGPHLPLFVDAECGTALGREVAWRLGNALVAPTIRVGCSEHHMDFPGTLSLQTSTFQAVCRDYCNSLARHGFRRICLMPTHGGNFQPIAEIVDELDADLGPDCRVTAYTDLMGLVDLWRDVVESESGLGSHVGGHADIAESSLMLVLHPDLVRQDAAEDGYHPESEAAIRRIIEEGLKSVTPNGILGNAHGMNEVLGRKCLEALADRVAAHFAA